MIRILLSSSVSRAPAEPGVGPLEYLASTVYDLQEQTLCGLIDCRLRGHSLIPSHRPIGIPSRFTGNGRRKNAILSSITKDIEPDSTHSPSIGGGICRSLTGSEGRPVYTGVRSVGATRQFHHSPEAANHSGLDWRCGWRRCNNSRLGPGETISAPAVCYASCGDEPTPPASHSAALRRH